eukprot:Skav236572  [mRNA]  locus=scaffold2180:145240:149710:- [translate_table: standard]
MASFPDLLMPAAVNGQPYCSVFTHVEQIDEMLTKAWDHGRQEHVLLDGVTWKGCTMTIYNLQLTDGELMLFSSGPGTESITAKESKSFDPGLVELCAGMGSMGVGPCFVGGQVLASVDCSSLACDHLRRNHHGHVIHGDLHDPHTTLRLHIAIGDAGPTVLLGFPCQPHSRQGSCLGSLDLRSRVLGAALHTVFLIRAQALIVECVPEASHDPAVLSDLRTLASVMGWQFHHCCLRHDYVGPSARHRWWGVLFPAGWDTPEFGAWPRLHDMPSIAHVLPRWGLWSHDEEHQLMLSAEEMDLFLDPSLGQENRMLSASQVCPTLLHSYGNVNGPCPCGCRPAALSMGSLRKKGLRGKLVKSHRTNMPRYLHPKEAAALLALPMSVDHDLGLRAALLAGMTPLDPLETIRHYRREILDQVRKQFPFVTAVEPVDFQLFHRQEAPVHLTSFDSASIASLLGAESISLGWGQHLKPIDEHGQPVQLDFCLAGRPEGLFVEIADRKQVVDRPTSSLVVVLDVNGRSFVSIIQPGSFLFEVVWEHDLSTTLRFTDAAGTFFGPDYRLWRSILLFALTTERFPTVRRPFLPSPLAAPRLVQSGQGGGLGVGLDDVAIWSAMLDLQSSVPCNMVHPIELSHLRQGQLSNQLASAFVDHRLPCCVVFCEQGHWVFLHGHFGLGGVTWTFFDGLDFALAPVARSLAETLSLLMRTPMLDFQCVQVIRQSDTFSCGTLAILHMAYSLGLRGKIHYSHVRHLHRLLSCRNHKRSWMIGFGPSVANVQAQLAAILATKGVPSEDAASRANMAIQRLGLDSVHQALQDANPWRALKALAEKPGNRFQFVLRTELQAFVDAKAKTRHGAEISVKKKERPKGRKDARSTWTLDPKQLELEVAQFIDEDEEPVSQTGLEEVKADFRGIALCSLSEAMPFVVDHKSISTDALALLIVEDVPAKDRGHAPLESLRFPVVFAPTSDPLLISGCLLQLGDVEVKRKQHEVEMASLDLGDTQVLKIQLFRDELGQEWNRVMESPIKLLIIKVPMFRLCTTLRCDHKCGMFHAAVEDSFDQIIHEVWARRYQTIDGRSISPDRADVFQVFLRAAAPAAEELLRATVEGIYMEPRSSTAKATDNDYAVVWLPGSNREAALHKLKLVSQGLSLVRMKHRFGIRVFASNEVTVYQALRPGDSFVKVEIRYVFKLHPLPHGLQRTQIMQVLKDWGWTAKALQPVKGSVEGGSWEVGAAEHPPSPVLQAFNRDVLITLVKNKADEPPPPAMVCPRRVQQHLKNNARSKPQSSPVGSDPWQQPAGDPWSQGSKMPSSNTTPSAAAQSRLSSITETLKADLTAEIQDQLAARNTALAAGDKMVVDNEQQEARLQQLEVGLQELHAHGKQMSQWCETAASRMSDQDAQMVTLQQSLSQTQQDLQVVRSEVQHSHDSLHQTLQSGLGTMKFELSSEMSNSLSNHMDRFERMLFGQNRRDA